MANLKKLIRRDAFDKIWFGYATGIRNFLPSITLERCYDSFCKYYDIDEDEFKKDNAFMIFNRMNAELRELNKGN